MSNFKDIVTGFSIGAISKSKVAFYAKRLSKETATRRLASLLMVGLLVFQFITFVAPPKPSYASSANDLVAGGPFSKESLISTVWNQNPGGIQQVFGRLQITQAKMQAATSTSACKGQGWLSTGRQNFGASTVFQSGIYIGTAESRWNQNCFNVILGKDKVQDTMTGQWYEWGVMLDCGNIILRKVPPPPQPKNISCQRLDSTLGAGGPFNVPINTEIGFRGLAKGENVTSGEKVNMAYGVYKPNGTDLGEQIGELRRADGIADNPPGTFQDPNRRTIAFPTAGTFTVRLWVSFNNAGDSAIAPGSATGSCAMQIKVQPAPAPKQLVCKDLKMQNTTGLAPLTPVLTGKADVIGEAGVAPNPSKYEYTLYKETPTETSQTVKMNGKFYLVVPGVAKIVHNNTTLRDPVGEPPVSFNADSFKQSGAGNFLIILRVYDQAGSQVADPHKECWQPFTVTGQQQTFSCLKLTASPSSSDTVPLVTTLTAQASALNTTIKEYRFEFGDGSSQTVQSSQLTQALQHTYSKGGRYTAKVTVVASDNTTSTDSACTTVITVEQQIYQKTVKNITLLTNDGKPTDANNAMARAGDKLTYTIGTSNLGSTPIRGFVFQDNISDVLEYADLTDPGGATVAQKDGQTLLTWPAEDIPVTPADQAPVFVSHIFTVTLKTPLPSTAQKPTDTTNYDCMVQDEFFGKIVKTPLFVNPAKRLECAAASVLPRTGSEALPLALISLFAASSLYLFFRNRLLKREIELVETLNDGAPYHG